jgi:DNA-directed RNA polymerase specialized sigma24 family protein
MAYNKARAEKEWLKWKNEEEAQLRELGVDEDTIQRLHTYDWAVFNSDRRFYEPQGDWTSRTDWDNAQWMELPVRDSASLLESLENEQLAQVLSTESGITLKILYLKISGFTSKEIGKQLGLSPLAVDLRMNRLRNKLRNLK